MKWNEDAALHNIGELMCNIFQGRDSIIDVFLYQKPYLNAIQTMCPHILRWDFMKRKKILFPCQNCLLETFQVPCLPMLSFIARFGLLKLRLQFCKNFKCSNILFVDWCVLLCSSWMILFLLRYITTAVVISKRRRDGIKELIKVLQQVTVI